MSRLSRMSRFPPQPLLFNAKPAPKKEPELKAEIKHHLSS